MKSFTRRTFFLSLGAFLALAPMLPPRVAKASDGARPTHRSLARWLDLVDCQPDMGDLGRRCVLLERTGAGAHDLSSKLDQTLRAHRLAPRGEAGADDLRAAFSALRRAEFASGEVVRVDGWILSRSEARYYALLALAA